jgi:hypothetical protein
MSALKTFAASLVLLALVSVASAGHPSSHISISVGSYHSSYSDHCSTGHCYTPSYSSYNYDTCYTPSYAPSYTPFQSCYYSNWSYDQAHSYYFCTCYFKSCATADYSKYYCVYSPSCGNYVYFYNPVSKLYWGRFDEQAKGFAVLPAADQKTVISDLPQDKFGAPAAQVAIPGSQVAENMPSPPDLPAVSAVAAVAAPAAQ